ncbi:methyltransferase domain-containing protein [SAR202 cluster bacterium AC-409-J13_OGT_754m]|nr:methyltransferase domain-containing protein [SAR202 cluster bacterium AC-409-J13_OGT_754m]
MTSFPEDQFQFWEERYLEDAAGWDLGGHTPVFDSIADELNPGKLCIIGCGRGHDVIMFAKKGFKVTAVDFAPSAIHSVKNLAAESNVIVQTVYSDIFQLDGGFTNEFDYIIEQTCFCAINPANRNKYETLVKRLLIPGGLLIGLWFPLDKTLQDGGPPWGTTINEVKTLFNLGWSIEKEEFPKLSIRSRKGREKLVIFRKTKLTG